MTQSSRSGLYGLVSSSVQSDGEQEEAKNTVHRYVNNHLSFTCVSQRTEDAREEADSHVSQPARR